MNLIRRSRDTAALNRSHRGQALLELALMLPLLILILLIAIDFGRVFHTYISLTNAAREGAAFATREGVNPCDANGIQAQARAEMGDNSIVVVPTYDPSCAPSTGTTAAGHHKVTVTVTTNFQFITPFISSGFGNLWGGFNGGAGLAITRAATAVIP